MQLWVIYPQKAAKKYEDTSSSMQVSASVKNEAEIAA